jgi:hypothetical protein
VTPLKAIDRFTSLTIIGMTKIMCNMAAAKMPQEEAEQLFSEETAELESTIEWPLSSTKRDKYSRGDRVDMTIEKTKT